MAIAFDNSVDIGSTSGNSVSNTLITAGSNQLIVVGAFNANTSTTSLSATVDGNAMTKVANSHQASTDSNQMALFYYVGTTAGSHTVAVSSTNSGTILEAVAASYNGVRQTGQPDASTTTTDDSISTKTLSLTTVANNSWMVTIGRWQGSAINAGTGATKRQQNDGGGGIGLFDSNAAITPAGSASMVLNRASGSGGLGTVVASFAPAGTTYTQTLTDTVHHGDTLIRLIGRPLIQTIAHSSTILRQTLRTFTQSVTHMDTVLPVRIKNSTLTELIHHADTLVHSVVYVLSETMAHTDRVTHAVARAFTDTLNHAATALKSTARLLTDAITHTANVSYKLNGTNVIWKHVSRSASSIWTHIIRSNQ